MAGGKETGRQKMIGMMYLVLTALLALNMSKEVLEAFVSIDSNVQEANRAVTKKANYSFAGLDEVAKDKTEPGRAKKAEFWLNIATQIREKTDAQIELIDNAKIGLLELVGETPETMGQIVSGEEGERKSFDLSKCTKKDNYDVPMLYFIGAGAEVTAPLPDAEGMKIWNSVLEYRKDLTSLMGTYKLEGGKSYTFSPDDSGDQYAQDYSGAHPEDTTKLRQLYAALTLKELADTHGGETKDVHWVGRTFDHAPVVAAIAQLSALQTTILNAEAETMQHIRAKVGGGEYSFNKITALAYGQEYANSGDSVTLQILMAAYDSNKDPKVFINGPEGKEIEVKNVKDGMAYHSFKATTSDSITGRIGIQNKNGEWKYKPFKKGISVGKPSGTVSLPEMNVLYRGYQNKVQGAASGFQSYKLSGSGCSLSKSGEYYIAKPGSGRTASISISGVNADGTSANLGKYEFRVQNMPRPTVYLGGLADGSDAGSSTIKAQSRFSAKYGPEIPLKATFSIVSWELSVSGAPRPERGNGSSLTAKAKSLLRQARKGAIISVMTKVKMPDGKTAKKGGTWKVR